MAHRTPRGHERVTLAQRAAEERVDETADQAKAGRWWPRRHLPLVSLLTLCLVFALGAGGYVWWLARTLDDIPRADMGVADHDTRVWDRRGVDLLVMATNSRQTGATVEGALADGRWKPGSLPGSGFFWIHLPHSGSAPSVVFISPSTWTQIPGYDHQGGQGALRDAFSHGGPALAVRVVEDMTDIDFDHAVVFDWQGLEPLTESVDGIRVYVPERVEASNVGLVWPAGLNYIKGRRAINYQLSGWSLPTYLTAGLDRNVWQQNLVRGLTDKIFVPSTIGNPLRLTRIVASLDDYVTLDSTWTSGDLRRTMLRVRSIPAGKVTMASLPLTGPYLHVSDDSPPAFSVDHEAADVLIDAVHHDRLEKFLSKNPQLSTRGITATD